MDKGLSSLITETDKLVKNYLEYFNLLKGKYKWGPSDPRLTSIGLTGNILVSHLINLTLFKTTLSQQDWWAKNLGMSSKEIIQHYADEYTIHIKSGLYVFFYGGVESSIRELYSLYFKKEPPMNFSKVYKEFFIKINEENLDSLFTFMSSVRNLIHSNGVYSKEDGNLLFRDRVFQVKKGVKVDFFTPYLILEIYQDLFLALKKIIESESIKTL